MLARISNRRSNRHRQATPHLPEDLPMATVSRRSSLTTNLTPTPTPPTEATVIVPKVAVPVFTSSVTPDEIIAPGTAIELTFRSEVARQSAQASIRVARKCEQAATQV